MQYKPEGTTTRKIVGREHPLDTLLGKAAVAAIGVFVGPTKDLRTMSCRDTDGAHILEVVGTLPPHIKRRLRRGLSWCEASEKPVRYGWRCRHDDEEAFWLRDADELLDLVELRRAWLEGASA